MSDRSLYSEEVNDAVIDEKLEIVFSGTPGEVRNWLDEYDEPGKYEAYIGRTVTVVPTEYYLNLVEDNSTTEE